MTGALPNCLHGYIEGTCGKCPSRFSSLEGHLSIVPESSQAPEYTGPYTVIPSASNNINLPTADKHCSQDINVVKIPRYETSNLGGGYTFIIAED